MNTAAYQTVSSVRGLQTRLLLVLLGVTLAVFAGVCGHEFVQYDDDSNIYNNPHVKGLNWENLQWMFTNASYVRRYMPLGWLSYAVDYQLFGLNPQAYHAGNLLLHLSNVVLLFFLLKRLLLLGRCSAQPPYETRLEAMPQAQQAGPSGVLEPSQALYSATRSGWCGAHSRAPQVADSAPVWCAAIGALFWAVNPLRVESVAWASSQIYCVAFFFILLWLLAWLRAHDLATSQPRRRLFYWMSVAAYAASLLTYPLAMFAPVVLFVLEVYPLRRVGARVTGWWKPEAWPIWRDKIPFVAVGGGVLVFTFFALVHTDARHKPLTMEEFSPWSRGMQAFYIWAYYLWKPWVPYDLAISYMTLHSFNPFALRFLLSAALVVGVTAGLLIFRRRWPAALGLWLCHLVLLVPVLGLSESPHSPYDRYSYVQGVLWSVALAVGLRRLWNRGNKGYLAGVTVAGASALFALLAWQHVAVWRDTIPLYENLLSHAGENPDRARSDTVLGLHYLRAGLTNEAIASFQNALHYELLRPNRRLFGAAVLPVAHGRLGDVYAQQGRLEEALAHYGAAAEADPGAAWAALKAGSTLAQLNRSGEAVKWLQAAVRLAPESAQAHHALAVALRKIGREAEALQQLQEERRLSGDKN